MLSVPEDGYSAVFGSPEIVAHDERVKLSDASIALRLRRKSQGLTLESDNTGSPCKISFAPQIPFDTHIGRAELNHRVRRAKHTFDLVRPGSL